MQLLRHFNKDRTGAALLILYGVATSRYWSRTYAPPPRPQKDEVALRPKLLDQTGGVSRRRHYSLRTEKAYLS